MARKDKHLRLLEPILAVMDEFASKSQRTKSVVFEMALREFITNKQIDLLALGISEDLIEQALNFRGS